MLKNVYQFCYMRFTLLTETPLMCHFLAPLISLQLGLKGSLIHISVHEYFI